MAYANRNYPTKKALKDAINAGKEVYVQDGMFGPAPLNGRVSLEGPWSPAPHRWWAECVVENGLVVKVK